MFKLFLIYLLLQVSILSQIKTEVVKYSDGTTNFKGFIAYNSGMSQKAPAVLIVHEFWGLNDYPKMRAEQLAGMGYVVFAVDMYGDGKVASSVEEASKLAGSVKSDINLLRNRIKTAFEFIKKDSRVNPDKIAIIGYCFGGTVALELARTGADVKGVVCFHGGVTTPNPQETKNVKAKILLCLGGNDKYVPDTDKKSFEDEMNNAGVDWQMIIYSGAVHSFTNPKSGNNPSTGAAYNKNADVRSYNAMKQFLTEVFE
jgi:dienelactone hydrolase